MKYLVFSIFLLFLFNNGIFGQKFSIYGIVKDSETGEFLTGATISVKDKATGTLSNTYGFYSLSLPAGSYTIEYSYIGYQTILKEFTLTDNCKTDVLLHPAIQKIQEVEVKMERSKVNEVQTGKHILSSSQIKAIPSVAGEADVFKSLQLLPGVQTANEGTTNLNVRGGSYDQNLILLDEAPVYSASHALGFFSTFNPDAIRNVTLYKSYFPPKYGDRLSSVVDISMKEGDSQKLTFNGGIGLIASRLSVEAPIIKDKASFIISGRYSYAGQVLNTIGSLGQSLNISSFNNAYNKNEINFYDLNAKINFTINPSNHIYLSTYTGHDHFYYFDINNIASIDWGNTTGTIRWNHLFNFRLFSNLTLLYSNYDYSYYLKDDTRDFEWSSGIKQASLKNDYDYFMNPKNHISFGFSADYQKFNPGKIEPRDSSSVTKPFELDPKNTFNASLYLNNEQKLTDKLTLSYGLRYNVFLNIGPGTVYRYNSTMETVTDSSFYKKGQVIQAYQGLEPRVSSNYKINGNNAVKLSYSHNIQNLHLLSNSSVGLPTDVWLPPDRYIKPQTANQFTLGYYYKLPKDKAEVSVETYYKAMNNVIDYIDNANLFLNPHIDTQIKTGIGRSFGMEVMIEKATGKLTGWLSYTLSKTTFQIDGINNNNPYPACYDKRHNLSVTANYPLSQKWTFSTVFKLTSGGFITIPAGTFYYEGVLFNYYTQRNGYTMPLYHRLDISLKYNNPKNQRRKWKSEWVLDIYNVYGRKNMFTLFIRQNPELLGESSAYKMYLFTIVPSVTYNFKF